MKMLKVKYAECVCDVMDAAQLLFSVRRAASDWSEITNSTAAHSPHSTATSAIQPKRSPIFLVAGPSAGKGGSRYARRGSQSGCNQSIRGRKG